MFVKFHNYTNTIRTCTDTMRTANYTLRIPVHAVDYQDEVFLHQSNQYMLLNQNNNKKKYYVVMKVTPLSGRHIRIGRRLDVNQP